MALAGAAIAVLVGAISRLGGPRALGVQDGRGATVAAIGFVLVLVGWAANLSISYWTMAQASLSLAVLTVATVVILASRRVESPVPVAWAGVALGVFGAILGFGQWGDLIKLGREQVELGVHGLRRLLPLRDRARDDHRRRRHDRPRTEAGQLRDGLEGRESNRPTGSTGGIDRSAQATASARSRIGVPDPP